MARPSATKEIIDKNLRKIGKWAEQGLTMAQIANNLGISESSLYKYQSTDSELLKTIKNARHKAVETLENTMYECVCGFTRTIIKHEKVKRIDYEDGKKVREYEEIIDYPEQMYFKPDMTAAIFLLKNWANYMNEPRALELREKEIEIQEKKLELSEYS